MSRPVKSQCESGFAVTPGRSDQEGTTVYFYSSRMEGKVSSMQGTKHGWESPQALLA